MVISCQTVAKCFDSLPAGPVSRTYAVFAYILQTTVATSDVIAGSFVSHGVSNNAIEFHDSGLNCLREIQLPKLSETLFSTFLMLVSICDRK